MINNKHLYYPARRYRFAALINIGIQSAFPLAVAFTPVIAGADSAAPPFLSSPGTAAPAPTRVHTLAPGETAESLAERYNMTPAELRDLNQLRTFSHGFYDLQPGEELNVPLAPLATLRWESSAQPDDSDDERRLAGTVRRAGDFLSNSPDGDAAASMARGMAAGAAGAAAEEWLSRFGNARVQLDVDREFSLKNSQIDLLAPLHDTRQYMVFTQGSFHRTDDRNQANLGAGVRRFNDGWMLGANAFLDYDLSRDHARAGLGLEYWRDFVKLGVNNYLGLTGWKDSPDVRDYRERPADGWDLRAEGWLPAYPQLGARLAWEQYYGEEVALFGRDNRQKNPRAVSAGVTWTPLPLLTLSAERREGQSGAGDTRYGMQMNLQLGTPWREQLNPDAVAGMRSLEGSRYDTVSRNNNIVLEYRRKEVIRMSLAGQVSGYPGERKSLGVAVSSQYGLERIDWSAQGLLAAGGRLENDGGAAWTVVLPGYRSGEPQSNRYVISGVAVDRQGNRSGRSEATITVSAPAASGEHTTLTPENGSLPADGKSQHVMTLSVRDAQQQPVDAEASDIILSAASGAAQGATVSGPVRKSAGVYSITVTAGTAEESLKISPSLHGVALAQAGVVISASLPDESSSSFTASPGSVPADGRSTALLSFSAKNANGHPVTGIADRLTFGVTGSDGSLPGAGITLGKISEKSPGIYSATLQGTRADEYRVTPRFSNGAIGSLGATLSLTAGTVPQPGPSTFSASPKAIAADGQTQSTLTLTAKDAHGNGIGGIADSLKMEVKASDGSVPGTGFTVGDIREGAAAGVYTATFKGARADQYTVTPLYNGNRMGSLRDAVTLVAGMPDGGQSAFTASPRNITADNNSVSVLTFEAKDASGNPLVGIAGQLRMEVKDSNSRLPVAGDVTLSTITESSTAGTYTATLKGRKSETYSITPMFSGAAVGSLNETIALTVGTPDETNSSFVIGTKTIVADGTARSTLTFTAKDAQGNIISGIAGKTTFVVEDADGTRPGQDFVTVSDIRENGTSGVYSATLVGARAGNYTITPVVNGVSIGTLGDTLTLEKVIFKNIIVNNHTFRAADNIFPTTASKHQSFKLETENSSSGNFNWKASESWVRVDEFGTVSFSSMPSSRKRVIITATPKNGKTAAAEYSFVVTKWFDTSTTATQFNVAAARCANNRMEIPSVNDYLLKEGERGYYSFAGEWGIINRAENAGAWYWTADTVGLNSFKTVMNEGGRIGGDLAEKYNLSTCVKELI